MKKAFYIMLLLLLPAAISAQGLLTNNGASIKIRQNTHLKASNAGIVNKAGGEISNEGNIHLDLDWSQIDLATVYAGLGWVKFEGSVDQSISGVSSIANLSIDNGNKLRLLNNDLSIGSAVNLNFNGSIELNGNDLVLPLAATMSGYDAGNFILADLNGGLLREVGAANVIFPVGKSSYNPAILNNAGTQDFFKVLVADEKLSNGTSGSPATNDAVNRSWFIEEGTTGGSNLSLILQWQDTDELPGFNRASSGLSFWDGSVWNSAPVLTTATAAGPNTWTQTRSGLSDLTVFSVEGCVLPGQPLLSLAADTICPGASTTLSLTGNLNGASTWALYADSCGGTLIASSLNGTFMVTPSATVTYFVRGEGGCASSAACGSISLVVDDLENPVISCPGNVSLVANSSGCQGIISIALPQASDNCGLVSVINDFNQSSDASGSFPLGNTLVTFTATDGSGNIGTCSFTVSVTSDLLANAGPDQVVIFNSGSGPDPDPCDLLSGSGLNGVGSYSFAWTPSTALTGANLAQPTVCPTAPTSYVLTVIDSIGCSASSSVFVNAIDLNGPLPCVNNGCNKVYVCVNGTTTVNANINANCNSVNSLCHLMNSGATLGACPSKTDATKIGEFEFKSFPNPFSIETNLTFSSPLDDQVTLRIFTLAGEEIGNPLTLEMKAGKTYGVEFGSEELASGIYIARLLSSKGDLHVKKLWLVR